MISLLCMFLHIIPFQHSCLHQEVFAVSLNYFCRMTWCMEGKLMNHKTLHRDGIVTRLHPCLHLDGHQSCQICIDDGTGLCKTGIMLVWLVRTVMRFFSEINIHSGSSVCHMCVCSRSRYRDDILVWGMFLGTGELEKGMVQIFKAALTSI